MRVVPWIVAVALLTGCGGPVSEPGSATPARGERRAGAAPETVRPETVRPETVRPETATPKQGPVLVAFGDSLTAGYGAEPGKSYPDFLDQELSRRGLAIHVLNEGVSGDTTAAALARIEMALAEKPAWAVIALGANDGLRGLPVEAMEANLRQMVERFRQGGAKVVLAGMTLPRNYGKEYIASFEAVFPRVAKDLSVPLLPFLLAGVAADPELNQEDGIHPTAEGNARVAAHVADFLEPLLRADERLRAPAR